MKITSNTQKKSKFTPITISVTIETQEEYDAINEITCFNLSIPRMVADAVAGKEDEKQWKNSDKADNAYKISRRFLDELRCTMEKSIE